jgi:hypothetical protein
VAGAGAKASRRELRKIGILYDPLPLPAYVSARSARAPRPQQSLFRATRHGTVMPSPSFFLFFEDRCAIKKNDNYAKY